MKKTLQTILLSICLLAFAYNSNAQTAVTAPGTGTWLGYMNIFDSTGTVYLWGSGWGLADVKSTVSASSVTIQPNFNLYNAADPYWANGVIGNKVCEALTYSESTALLNQTVTFDGNVLSNTLSAGYAATIFVKALDPAMGYAAVVNQTIPVPASGSFSVSAAIPNTPGLIVQWGFTVTGLNANPAAETALGSIVIGPAIPAPLNLIEFNASNINGSVALNWTTVDEENVEAFEIQKSNDGINFGILTTILAQNEARNTYEVFDNNVLNDTYYRLKMVDQDGTYKYSSIKKVIVHAEDILTIIPNPAIHSITILTAGSNNLKNAVIMNIRGQIMHKFQLKNATEKIDISHLPQGFYSLHLDNGNSMNFIKR